MFCGIRKSLTTHSGTTTITASSSTLEQTVSKEVVTFMFGYFNFMLSNADKSANIKIKKIKN